MTEVKMIDLGNLKPGDAGTEKTIKHLTRLIKEGSQHPEIILTARKIVMGANSNLERAKRIFEFVRDNFSYVQDPKGIELIRPAHKILESRIGDCDEHVVVLNSLYRAVGIPSVLVTISTPKAPFIYTHVYSMVKVNNKWFPVDTTVKGAYFGWEYPFAIRKKIWPIDSEKPDIGALKSAYTQFREGMKEAISEMMRQKEEKVKEQIVEAQERTNYAWMIFIGLIVLLLSLTGGK